MIRNVDWSATSIGPPTGWPIALGTLVEVMLGSKQPMFVAWGADGIMLYNESYAEILGRKHPAALGRPLFEVWAEIRDELTPIVEQTYAGIPVHMDHISLVLERHGYKEEAHFAFSYTPVRDAESGQVAGFFCCCRETTAQVLAERQLRENEAEARGVLEGMGEGFLLLDRLFRIQRINAEGLRLDRRRREDIIGRHLLEVWPEAKSLPVWPAYQRAIRQRSAEQLVYHHVAGTREYWLEVRIYPSNDGLAVFYRDVTHAKRAEQALRANEAQFRALAQAIPNQAWTAQPGGDIDWVNDQMHTYTGLDHASLTGKGWMQVVHPDDMARVTSTWTQSVAAGAPYEAEFRLRRVDGAYRWHLVRAQPIRSEQSDVIQWIGANTDIEDQWVATGALAVLNTELEQRVTERTAERDRVWRNSRDLLAVLDADGTVRAANPAWTSILGHLPQDVVGRSILNFIWPSDADQTRSGLGTAVAQGNLTNFENRYRHKDGTPRWISWHMSVESGLIYAYGRDITAEKEQAEALRQTEEALRQAQKMEAVGQLTGGLAHDFNNLLTGISGSLELLQLRVAQGRLSELDRHFITAQGATRRAAALTHRLLAFSRRQTLAPKPTDVNQLVTGMAELIQRTVGPSVALEVTDAAGLWTLRVDPNQLENALLNLCINARDAMPDGGSLVIKTCNKMLDMRAARKLELAPGDYVSLSVADTGTGMTPDVMRHAFDPFYTTKPIGSGTGLGLSMIYGFVRQSGGQARINSTPGLGTTVCLYLPRHQDAPDEADTPISAIPRQPTETGQTILVVDDEAAVRTVVTETLKDNGYVPIETEDGPSALRVLDSNRPIDLLITDVGLPGGINGRQLADMARTLRPGLKVMFITGYAEHAVVRNGDLEAGMHVLAKPFTIEDLAVRLDDIIRAP
jgi:PAS domain S-box-containing protein